jgi:hypothetical protein
MQNVSFLETDLTHQMDFCVFSVFRNKHNALLRNSQFCFKSNQGELDARKYMQHLCIDFLLKRLCVWNTCCYKVHISSLIGSV